MPSSTHAFRVIAFTLIVASVTLLFTGCATRPEKLQSTYVDPLEYRGYECDQVEKSMRQRSRRIADLHAKMSEQASADAGAVAVSLILFWPAAFFVSGGNQADVIQYQRMMGEYRALEKQAVSEACTNTLTVKSPDELIRENAEPAVADAKYADGTSSSNSKDQDETPGLPYDHPSRNHY